ncbi:MAG: helix-turn-helix transcriptional regulator [Erysipelotrichaceae bacterium]|nr:helix-turn-helix transcriptional regulator [Clostridia bacterium]MBQ6217665.1 helix-turn-helix transcriptional regulator [Erysipelotrichaceae bacterium]
MIDYSPFFKTIKEKKISQYELKHMGISSCVLESIKKGKSITLNSLNMLCTIIDCEPHDIFTFERTEEDVEYYKQFSRPSHRQDLHKHPLKSDKKLSK